MEYKSNVSCSETLNKKWTTAAIECYQIGCTCSKCSLYRLFFVKRNIVCRMKETVIELVRQVGIPEMVKDDIQEQKMVL